MDSEVIQFQIGEVMEYGDLCPQCGQWMVVYNTKRRAAGKVRFFHCRACGHKPEGNKQYVPQGDSRSRRRSPRTLVLRTRRRG